MSERKRQRTYGVIEGALVEVVDTVSLGDDGRGEMDTHHLKNGVTGREELAHDGLEELLLALGLLLAGEGNVELFLFSEWLGWVGE